MLHRKQWFDLMLMFQIRLNHYMLYMSMHLHRQVLKLHMLMCMIDMCFRWYLLYHLNQQFLSFLMYHVYLKFLLIRLFLNFLMYRLNHSNHLFLLYLM